MDQGTRPVVSKWLWITLIVVAIAAIIFGTWYYLMGPGKKIVTTTTPVTTPTTATTDKTADWLTYANTTYNFTMKYPKDWTKKTNSGEGLVQLYSKYDELGGTDLLPTNTKIVIYAKTPASIGNLEAWVVKDNGTIDSTSDVTVGGVSGKKFNVTPQGIGTKSTVVYILKDNVYFEIICMENSDQFDTILSTFQFTATDSATADWKTYTGKYEGITLKYPSTWNLVEANKTINDYKGSGLTGPFENFILTSPNNYEIKYTTHIDGLGGGCDEGINCPKTFFYNVFSMINANFTNLQLLQLERREQDNKTVKSREVVLWNPTQNVPAHKNSDVLEGLFYSMYSDKGVDKLLSQLSGGFKNEDNYLSKTTSDYFNQADVKEAVSILKTVTFK